MRTSCWPALAGLAAVALLSAGCSANSSTSGSSGGYNWSNATSAMSGGGMTKLVAAAKQEGTLNVIALPNDWANYGTIIKTFTTKYGIKVNSIAPSDSSAQEVTQIEQKKGTSLAADEIVSGTFRNISGTISMLDAAAGTLVVQDLTTKKPVTIKISADSQLRKLTPPIAQRIAARMKGESPTPGGASGAAAPQQTSATPNAGAPYGGGSNGNGSAGGAAGPGGRAGGGQGGDLQQMISRMPAASLSDLQKGDAVMLVSTEGTAGGAVTAITLLAGVEPILQASPGNSSLLSAWSLGGAPGGDSGTP